MGTAQPAPIIVTAALPADVLGWADRLRRAHFPPERNVLTAHCTLFHAIAPSCEVELRRLLADITAAEPPPRAQISGLMSLGRGTALRVESRALIDLRQTIADRFAGVLTAQDRQQARLHVTIQNKVAPALARTLQAELARDFVPVAFAVPAFEAHFYRGGPWELAGRWPFRGRGKAAH